jgi:hypothetical protein
VLPFWGITEKFIEGAMPVSPSYRTVVSQQQAFLNNNGYNIQYQSNWYTPWDDVTDREYTGYYLSDNPAFSYLLNDHLEVRLYNNYTELSRFEINKLKAKLEQYIASPDMQRAITHNNWGEYGHRHHIGLNKAVRELAVKYRKDVWMLGCDNGGFRDITVPNGITYTSGSFDDPELYLGIRTIYENNNRWTWYTDRVPSGDHKFIKVVDRGSDKSYILKGDEIEYPGPSQLEPGAYIFDGDDDYLTLKGNNNSSFTISMRIRPEVIREMDISMMSEYPGSGKNDRNIFLNSDGKVTARIFDGSTRVLTSDASIEADSWSHVAITGNGSSLRLYVNGILEKTISTGTAITNYSTPELVLGLATETGSNFEGQINDVAMYSRALSDTEVAALCGTVYTITAEAGSGGSINPSGSVRVPLGANKSFEIIPDTGYRIENVNIDDKSKGAITNYTFTDVTEGHTISVTFRPITYSLTSSSGPGGSISPSGAASVNRGDDRTYTVTPSEGYMISDVRVDNSSVGRVASFTFSNINSNHTISASFSEITYSLVAGSGKGGSISPLGNITVNYGANSTFSIIPDDNFHILDVRVDDASVGRISSYRFDNITDDHAIFASFAHIIQTITGNSGPGGSIIPKGETAVEQGDDVTCTIAPDTGYLISEVKVDGVSMGKISSFKFRNVVSSHSISATFTPVILTVKGSSSPGRLN